MLGDSYNEIFVRSKFGTGFQIHLALDDNASIMQAKCPSHGAKYNVLLQIYHL